MSLERNLRNSFAQVRKEILEVKNQILRLAERQQELAEMISKKEKKTGKRK